MARETAQSPVQPERITLEQAVEALEHARYLPENLLARLQNLTALQMRMAAIPLDMAPSTASAAPEPLSIHQRSALRLSDGDIRTLVNEGKHDEIVRRFSEAREVLISAVQLNGALESYQRAIGGVQSGPKERWSDEKKAFIMQRLNRLAGVTAAHFQYESATGRLKTTGPSKTFQLRNVAWATQRIHGLGQSLPLLHFVDRPPNKGRK